MRTGWRLIRKHELTYLRGIEHGFARLQRREKRSRDWMEHHQQKIARLRAQIACDQEYIDALEERVTPDDLKAVRLVTRELRTKRALL